MAIFQTAAPAVGAFTVLGFLIRNLFRRPGAVASATFPSYMRMTYNVSHIMCLCFIVPWTIAAFEAADFQLYKALMVSPFALAIVLTLVAGKLFERQSPEVKAYAQELTKNSWVKRAMNNRGSEG